jgi:uncharacterized protein
MNRLPLSMRAMLSRSVYQGDLRLLQEWFGSYSELSLAHKQALYYQLLREALVTSHVHIVRWLLDQGVSVDTADSGGGTLLDWACFVGQDSMVRFLLDSGAQVNVRNLHGITPLHTACSYGNLPTVLLLLARGADPDARTIDGHLPDENTDQQSSDTRWLLGEAFRSAREECGLK